MEATPTTTPIVLIHAYVEATYLGSDRPQGERYQLSDTPQHATVAVETPAVFATRAEAEAHAATLVPIFPKSARLHPTSGGPGGTSEFTGSARTHVTLSANGNNGGVNETGIKRLRSIVRSARKAGLQVEVAAEGAVNLMTPARFFALIGEPEAV